MLHLETQFRSKYLEQENINILKELELLLTKSDNIADILKDYPGFTYRRRVLPPESLTLHHSQSCSYTIGRCMRYTDEIAPSVPGK
jgi:hypothetical protein